MEKIEPQKKFLGLTEKAEKFEILDNNLLELKKFILDKI